MSTTATKRMLAAYVSKALPTMFLSSLFLSPPENFYNSEEVEIDIQRGSEDVSIVVQDLSTGYRMNSADLYTNKGLKAPVHKEAAALNSFELMKRAAGDTPFENPNFRANVVNRVFDQMTKVENKIRRAIELQASQVLTLGVVTLVDSGGVALYSLDYKPKVAHFPTSAIAWNAAGATPIEDLRSLAEVVRGNGMIGPDQLIMGEASFEAFVSNAEVQKRFETRRIDLGTIAPMQVRGAGNYRGVVEVGNYRFDVWTYSGRFKHPQTGVSTPYIPNDKVIVRASAGRMDATFGNIPNIGRELGMTSQVSFPELPGRFSNAAGGMDLHTNLWLTPDGEQLFAGVGCRPLLIPTAIDTYGCLDTGI